MWSFKNEFAVGFIAGTLLDPEPPVTKMSGPWNRNSEYKGRRIDIKNESEFEENLIRSWIEQAKQFTSELTELKDYFKIPGLAVSIEKNGENIYREYFGSADLEKSINVDSTILFPIASITKVFSGVIVMKLVEQEKLIKFQLKGIKR